MWGDQAYRSQRAVIWQHAPKGRLTKSYRHRGVVDKVGQGGAGDLAPIAKRRVGIRLSGGGSRIRTLGPARKRGPSTGLEFITRRDPSDSRA